MAKKKSLEWQDCSEAGLEQKIKDWCSSLNLQDTIILLEGEMGAGKSTFARALIHHFCPDQKSKGSPTFPIIQEYQGKSDGSDLKIYHLDLYRLKSAEELYDSGIESQLEESRVLALVEWGSLFSSFFAYWTDAKKPKLGKRVYWVEITMGSSPELRNIRLSNIELDRK